MLHGKGIGNNTPGDQSFLTKSYEDGRKKGLRDRTSLTQEEKELYEISGSDGGGRTLESTFVVEQFPFPTDPTIRQKKEIDVKKVDPRIGEISD